MADGWRGPEHIDGMYGLEPASWSGGRGATRWRLFRDDIDFVEPGSMSEKLSRTLETRTRKSQNRARHNKKGLTATTNETSED